MSNSRPTQSGRFEYLNLLGKGGMGEVWQARDGQLARDVAIKVVVSPDPVFREILQSEAQTLAKLPAHPNVVVLYDILAEAGNLGLVMEFLPGRTLDQVLATGTPLAWPHVHYIMGSVLAGVAHAHSHGVIHRDLKPENILMVNGRTPSEAGPVKVLDFGIARAQQERKTSFTRSTMGTYLYMSPEQLLGQPQGPATDVYALGLILYRLVTGQFPYGDARHMTEGALVNAHLHAEPLPPSRVNPAVPQALEEVILKAIQKNPTGRFPNAAEFHRAVAPILQALVEGRRVGPLPVRPNGGTQLDPKVHGGGTPAPLPSKPFLKRPWVLGLGAISILWLGSRWLSSGSNSTPSDSPKRVASTPLPSTVAIPGGTLVTADHRRVPIAPFQMAPTPVTQAQWETFVKEAGYQGNGIPKDASQGNLPVVNVSYEDALEYIHWLRKKTGESWALPTREQFEYAAREGGKSNLYPWGNRPPSPELARFASTGPKPVGSYPPNGLGLYDMAGNCWQWTSTQTPQGTQVVKGGSWADPPVMLQVQVEGKLAPTERGPKLGIRVVRNG